MLSSYLFVYVMILALKQYPCILYFLSVMSLKQKKVLHYLCGGTSAPWVGVGSVLQGMWIPDIVILLLYVSVGMNLL